MIPPKLSEYTWNKRFPLPEFLDPVFAKTSPRRSVLHEFVLVFAKTGSMNSGTGS
jgi:hypothetical protein